MATAKQVLRTLTEMMAIRGYGEPTPVPIPPKYAKDITYPVMVATRVTPSCTAREPQIILFLVGLDPLDHNCAGKLGVNRVRQITAYMESEKQTHSIVVHGNGGITPTAAQHIVQQNSGAASKNYIEIFACKTLMFNPVLYEYEVLGQACGNVGRMSWTDIQRRFHDWPAGTVVCRRRQLGSLCDDRVIRIVDIRNCHDKR